MELSIIILSLTIVFLIWYLVFKTNRTFGVEKSSVQMDELNEVFLFDFMNFQSGGSIVNVPIIGESSIQSDPTINNIPVGKIKVKPIDVLNELETIPTPFTLMGIDQKIDMLKIKANFIKQHHARKEVNGLIERLENRKKYDICRTFFDGFLNTNDEKINSLLEKYDLVMKPSDLFVPEFPDDAISIMEKYREETKKICSKSPVFYVIATSDNFKSADKKRDPILLVQSPFGFYWQILGAWDKEMLILHEL